MASSKTSRGIVATSRTGSNNSRRWRPRALREVLRRRRPFGAGTRSRDLQEVLRHRRLEVCRTPGRSRRCRCGRCFRPEISTWDRVYVVGETTQLGSAAIPVGKMDHFREMLTLRLPSVFLFLAKPSILDAGHKDPLALLLRPAAYALFSIGLSFPILVTVDVLTSPVLEYANFNFP